MTSQDAQCISRMSDEALAILATYNYDGIEKKLPGMAPSELHEDGYPYCTVCGERRVTDDVIPFFERRMFVACLCTREKMDSLRKEKELADRARYIKNLKNGSYIHGRYKEAKFKDCKLISDSFNSALTHAVNYCDAYKEVLRNGYGMYIFGKSGTGKTHLAACMCNDLIDRCKRCIFLNFYDIGRMVTNENSSEVAEKISGVDYLFIDDIGTERLRKNGEDMWMQEQVFDIINQRYNNKKPTVFTSNYTMNELADRGMMEKTIDRIREMSTRIIRIETDKSYRENIPEDIPF